MLINWLARASLIALITLGCARMPAGADSRSGLFSSPLEAAVSGRDDVRTLKSKGAFDGRGESSKNPDDDEYAKTLGFASVEEAAKADLGSSYRIYRVDILMLQ